MLSAFFTTLGTDPTPDEYYTAVAHAKSLRAELLEMLTPGKHGSSAAAGYTEGDLAALVHEVIEAVVAFASLPVAVADPNAGAPPTHHVVAVLMDAPLAATRLERELGTASAIQILEEHRFPDDVAGTVGPAAVRRVMFSGTA